jgi:hypothetical protein
MTTTKSVKFVSGTPVVDERSVDRSKVLVLHSDMHNLGNWNQFISTNAGVDATTISYDQGAGTSNLADSSGDTLGVAILATKSGAAGSGGRAWIADRYVQQQPALLCGYHEMSFECRVKLEFGASDANVEMRCGFQTGHQDPGTMQNALCFICLADSSTWKVLVRRQWDGAGSQYGGANEYSKEIDTKVSVTGWHVLRVDVTKTGDMATFYIDNRVVHVQQGFLPTWQYIMEARKAASVSYDETTIRAANEAMKVAVGFRTTSSTNPAAVHKMYCDWSTFKFYR